MKRFLFSIFLCTVFLSSKAQLKEVDYEWISISGNFLYSIEDQYTGLNGKLNFPLGPGVNFVFQGTIFPSQMQNSEENFDELRAKYNIEIITLRKNMNSKICELLDIEFPLVAFTHCRDVVVAVSKAGGCGVLGAVGMTPAQLEEELKWIDDHIDGLPYGVDVLIPNKMAGKDQKFDSEKLVSMIPQEYADFRADLLEKHDIEASEFRTIKPSATYMAENTKADGAKALLDVAFAHPRTL